MVAHNAGFDTGFIRENAKRLNLPYDHTVVDTLGLAKMSKWGHLGKILHWIIFVKHFKYHTGNTP